MAETSKQRRDRAWAIVTTLDAFSLHEMMDKTGTCHTTAKRILRDWRETGHIIECGSRGQHKLYKVNPDAKGARIDRDRLGREMKHADPQGNMWRVMRSMPSFSARDVAMLARSTHTDVTEREAARFCSLLANAGYLRVIQRASETKTAVYRLIRNTGPLPPEVKRVRCLYDPNEGGVTHVPGLVKDA